MAMEKNMGALASAAEEPTEAAEQESPGYEAKEEASPGMEAGEPGEAAEGQGGQQVDPRMMELFQLTVGRVREGLAAVAQNLDAALKADPLEATIKFGTEVLRKVVMAASKAGKQIPFEVIMATGMQTIKDLAGIAVEKGYMDEGQLESFMKEAFQRSLTRYTQLDMADGLIDQSQVSQLQQKMGMGSPRPRGALAQGAM